MKLKINVFYSYYDYYTYNGRVIKKTLTVAVVGRQAALHSARAERPVEFAGEVWGLALGVAP